MKVLQATFALAILCWPGGVLSRDLAPVKIGELQVREFVKGTGEWRRVKVTENFFYGWNWPGLDRSGSNDDLEILVPLIGDAGTNVSRPLVITLTSRRTGKIIESRRLVGLKLPDEAIAYQVIHLRDVACTGPIDVVAKLGTQKSALTLGLDCGE